MVDKRASEPVHVPRTVIFSASSDANTAPESRFMRLIPPEFAVQAALQEIRPSSGTSKSVLIPKRPGCHTGLWCAPARAAGISQMLRIWRSAHRTADPDRSNRSDPGLHIMVSAGEGNPSEGGISFVMHVAVRAVSGASAAGFARLVVLPQGTDGQCNHTCHTGTYHKSHHRGFSLLLTPARLRRSRTGYPDGGPPRADSPSGTAGTRAAPDRQLQSQ